MFYTMIKLKNNKTKFIYTKSAGYIKDYIFFLY